MNWLECSDRMDQYVIKKDGTAVDVEYFMATHVPFRDLERAHVWQIGRAHV